MACGYQWAGGFEEGAHRVGESEANQENTSRHSVADTVHCCCATCSMLILRCGQLLCELRYLDKGEEMRVALHLSARELETVFFLPAVVLVRGEELVEL